MDDSESSKNVAGPTRHLQAEIAFLKKVKLSLNNPEVYQEFLLVLKAHRDRKISTKEMLAKVNEYFAGRDELAEEFKTFLKPKTRLEGPADPATIAPAPVPESSAVGAHAPFANSGLEEENKSKAPLPKEADQDEHRDFLVHAQRLVQLIKGYYSDRPDIYQGFLQLLKQYVNQSIPFERVAVKVGDLFVDHPGLIEAFAAFLPDHRSKTLRELAEEKKKELDAASKRSQSKSTKSSKRRLLEGYEKKLSSNRTLRSAADPEWTDTVNGERQHRWGPSYVILSDEKVQAKHKYSTGRDKLGWSVLNDRMVCTQNGSEAYKDSFKTPFEDVLFKIEDDQFELDITIGKCLSTIEHLRDMQKAISESTFNIDTLENGDFPIIGPLQRIALRMVFRDGFDTVMEVLRQQPMRFMSEFFPRLVSQTDQWIRARYSWRGIWRNAQRRCYPRSLDYQGACFKQDEIRKTNPKWIVAQARKSIFDSILHGSEPDFHSQLRFPSDPTSAIEVSLKMLEKVAYKLYPSGTEAQQAVSLVAQLASKVVSPPSPATVEFYATQPHYVLLFLIHLLVEKVELARSLVSFDSGLFDFTRVLEPQSDTQWLHLPVQEIELHGLPPVGSIEPVASAERDSGSPTSAPAEKDVVDPDAMEVDPTGKADPSSSDEESVESADSGATDGTPAPRRSKRGESSPPPFGYVPDGLSYDTEDPMLRISPDKKFSTFLTILEKLVEGDLDQQSYEDSCLKMLGPKCFPLFTFHAALMQLARQAKNMVTTPEIAAASKAVSRYLDSLTGGLEELLDIIVKSSKGIVRVAHIVFHPSQGQLYIKLRPLPGEADLVSTRDRWVNYVTAYVASDPVNLIPSFHRVFLPRNRRSSAKDPVPPICVRNDGLEAVVRSKDFHLVFVEGTSDFLMKTRADLAPPLRVPGPIRRAYEKRQAALKRTASLSHADRSQRLTHVLSKLVKS